MHKILPLILLGVGVFILVQIILPPLTFQIWQMTTLKEEALLVDPSTPLGASPSNSVLGVSISEVGNFPALVDSTTTDAPYQEFSLTAPTIKLKDTKVKVNSNDFESSLAHLPGSALPGERGNVFITGHSFLTQFYSPGNFQAIFSNLPNLKKGDEITLSAPSGNFTYTVVGLKVVDPKDISVVNPPDEQGRYLSLMTCVPPGFNTKRLIVLAKLK